jgi:hypothetical protein
VVQLAQPAGEWSGQPPTPAADGIQAAFLGAELRADPGAAEGVFGDVLEGRRSDVEGGVAYSWPGGGTLVVRPATAGKGGVERFVFRFLRVPEDSREKIGETELYAGPTTLVRLAPDEPWPDGVNPVR